jgi:hypothetical protein
MAIDSSRASFVQKEWRYQTASDPSVKSVYPNATPLVLETNFTRPVAQAIANSYLEETKVPSDTLSFELEGLITIDDWAGGPTRYALTAPMFNANAKVSKSVLIDMDYNTGTYLVTVR